MHLTQKIRTFWDKTFPLFQKTWRDSSQLEIGVRASNLAFTTILSIVPLFALMLYASKILGGLDYGYTKIEPYIFNTFTEAAGDSVVHYLKIFITRTNSKTLGWIGFLGLLATACLTYSTVFETFLKIWAVRRPVTLLYRLYRAVMFFVLAPILFALSITMTTLLSAKIIVIPFGGFFIAVLLNSCLFSIVYLTIPARRLPIKRVMLGSLLPGFLWEVSKTAFAFYTSKIVSYKAFYGSFAALPVFLIWIQLGWYITLLGAVWIHTLHEKNKAIATV